MNDHLLIHVLRKVEAGEQSFKPDDRGLEAIQHFQKVAEAVMYAARCGYLSGVSPRKESFGGTRFVTEVHVLDGVTHEGRLALDQSADGPVSLGAHVNLNLLNNEAWRGPLMLAIQRGILEAELDAEEWRKLGFQTGLQDYIDQHPRLLRSLAWGDPDYGDCILQTLQRLTQRNPAGLTFFIEHPKIFPVLEREASAQLVQLGYGVLQVAAVAVPPSASEVVRRAINDADNLLVTSGAVSTIDRLHTALHGYIRSLCKDQGIQLPAEASITSSYKILRKEHPAFKSLEEHQGETSRILASLASVIDALNTLRNNASVAHPNEKLLGQAEGMLVVNTVRTLFHYLNHKLAANA